VTGTGPHSKSLTTRRTGIFVSSKADDGRIGPPANGHLLAFYKPFAEDVSADHRSDLVCHFYIDKSLKYGDKSVILEGMTLGGQLIRGTAAIDVDR
jgi:hypothetical protein